MYSPFDKIDLGVPISFDVMVTSGGVDELGKLFHRRIVPETVDVTIVFSPLDHTPQGQESFMLT